MTRVFPNEIKGIERDCLLMAREKWISGEFSSAKKILQDILNKPSSDLVRLVTQLELGYLIEDSENYPEALEHLELAKKIAEDLNNEYYRAWAMVGLTRVALRQDYFDRAFSLIEQVKEIFERVSASNLGYHAIQGHLGHYYMTLGEYKQTIDVVTDSVENLNAIDHLEPFEKVVLARLYNILAITHQYLGNLDAAIMAHEKGFEIASKATKLGYRTRMAMTSNNMGEAYRLQGKYTKALECYNRALRINQAIGVSRGAGIAIQNMGLVLTARGEYKKAAEYFERALEFKEESSSPTELAIFIGDMAAHEHLRGDVDKALQLFEHSIQSYMKLGSETELVINLYRYSGVLLELGNFSRAEVILREAEELAIKHKSRYESLLCKMRRATLNQSMNNFGKAKVLLWEVLDGAEEISSGQLAISASLALAENALYRYQRSWEEELLNEAKELVTKAVTLARIEKLPIVIGQTLLLQAMLAKEHFEYQKAYDQLTQVSLLAEEYDLSRLNEKANQQLKHLKRVQFIEKRAVDETLKEDISILEAIKYLKQCQRLLDTRK